MSAFYTRLSKKAGPLTGNVKGCAQPVVSPPGDVNVLLHPCDSSITKGAAMKHGLGVEYNGQGTEWPVGFGDYSRHLFFFISWSAGSQLYAPLRAFMVIGLALLIGERRSLRRLGFRGAAGGHGCVYAGALWNVVWST